MTQRRPLSPEATGLELAATKFDYNDRDLMLYALGVGASELDFVFERNLKALPTFAVIPAFPALLGLTAAAAVNHVMLLHGLCRFGHVGRAVLAEYCGNDPSRLVGMSVRFTGVVYPGDTITTEMWDEGSGRIVLQAKTQEGRVVIRNAAAGGG